MTWSMAYAQVAEPKFAGEAALLNEDGTLTMLQNETGNLNMSFTVTADGMSSTTRIPSNDIIQLIVKSSNVNESPASTIVVFKMKPKKNKRTASLGAYGIKSKDIVKFKGDTYGENSYIITLENLSPGEYGLWYGDKIEKNTLGEHQMSFFGID